MSYETLTPEQRAAREQLSLALTAATDSGLFDTPQAWDCIHPDTINAFCEGVGLLERLA